MNADSPGDDSPANAKGPAGVQRRRLRGGGSLREFFNRRSLTFRLYIIIIPTTVAAISLLGYLADRAVARMLDAQVQGSTVRVADQLARDLSRANVLQDLDGVRRLFGDLVESNYFIVRIDLFQRSGGSIVRMTSTSSLSGRPITVDEFTAVRQARSLIVTQYREGERLTKVIAPIFDRGGVAGCVSVISTLRQSDLVGEVHSTIALFLIPATVLVLIVLLHFLFTRGLTRRINGLLAAMKRARSGSLDKRLTEEPADELGSIAQGFNHMMEEIERGTRDRDRLLEEQKGFNLQLQEKVQEATLDLSGANEQLRRLNQDLVETQRRLTHVERMAVAGQMAAAFAHEIGSPLSAISTHLQLMAEDRALDESARRRLGLVQEQVARITGFVEELLSETRAAAQPRLPIQLNSVLQQLLLFLEQHLARHGVTVHTRFDPGLPEIEANPQQLQQVFMNLLNNACDALPGGGAVRVETRTETGAGGKTQVIVAVSDDGVGIPREKQEHIFEPFFSTKDLQSGAGLGLSIAARIIHQHRGAITLESAPGAGSTFTVHFPAPDGQAEMPQMEPAGGHSGEA